MQKIIGNNLLKALCLTAMLIPGPGCASMSKYLENGPTPGASPCLRVLTLNVAHGRGVSVQPYKQVFMKTGTIRKNLGEIAKTLKRENADVVALQEADGPSVWSGKFNHVAELARLAEYPHHFRGEHMKLGKKLSYGTALLSKHGLTGPESHRFERSIPTPRKGFVVAAVKIPSLGNVEVDVVSVHLDFLRKKARNKQLKLLAEKLENRNRPLVIMGDMNCELLGKESCLRELCEMLGVRAFEPLSEKIPTFPSKKPDKRLDWILISDELEFLSYRNVPDRLSDHLGVVAEIVMK